MFQTTSEGHCHEKNADRSRADCRRYLLGHGRRHRGHRRIGRQFQKTLVTAVQAAGLVDTLKGPGSFTVFAPTDAAFAKISKAKLDALLADKAALTKVLTYHVVPAKVMAADVKGQG